MPAIISSRRPWRGFPWVDSPACGHSASSVRPRAWQSPSPHRPGLCSRALGNPTPTLGPGQLREALGPARDVVRPNSTLSLPPPGQARGTCWAAAPVPPQPAVRGLPGSPDTCSGPVPAPSEGPPARVPTRPATVSTCQPACASPAPDPGVLGTFKGVLLLPVPAAHSPWPWPGLTGSLLRCCLQGPPPPGRSCRSCLQWEWWWEEGKEVGRLCIGAAPRRLKPREARSP